MIRSTKNILTIVTLTLLCVPTLHCDDTQQQTQTASELTITCDKLKNLIEQADVTAFKTTYDTFMKSCVPECSTVVQELVTTAQDMKQKLEKELAAMGDNKVNKKTLAKGALQTIGGLYGIANVAFVYWVQYLYITTHLTPEEKTNGFLGIADAIRRIRKIENKIAPYAFLSLADNAMITASELGSKTTNSRGRASWWFLSPVIPFGFPFLFLATITYISGNQVNYGLNKIKTGWDYKAYLEQQIKNLDEIITHIQTQAALK